VLSINIDNEEALGPWGGGFRAKDTQKCKKRNYFKIQYNLKPSVSPTVDVTFGKLMDVQSVPSEYQKRVGIKK
jgi:hypothetical protein